MVVAASTSAVRALKTLSVDEVMQQMERVRLEMYREIFEENGIDGMALLACDPSGSDFEAMGMKKFHAKKLCLLIADWQQDGVPMI